MAAVDGDTSTRPLKRGKSEEDKQQQKEMVAPVIIPSNRTDGKVTWREVHEDLEKGVFAGVHGSHHACYFGLAELRTHLNLEDFHTKRSPDEFYVESLDRLLKNPHTQRRWDDISTIDPLGMYAKRPTMSATEAQMVIPELKIEPDHKVVNENGSFNCVKLAIDYAWNLQLLSERLGMKEPEVREALYKYSQNDRIRDTTNRVFLPPVGGMTVYFFGDLYKLSDPQTEVAVRVHDQCTGSDVFGTDICTCRPYLVFAVKGAVECAMRGGVGVVVYFQKEGRSLGEVTKFRVYNARKAQKGGDRPEKYFYQTESIAGIRDARFQELMPDVLLWLGITRIDWLLSMSSDKYDAIVGRGIEVMQRVSLPDQFVPTNAQVEITAKVSAGYHTETMMNDVIIDELRSLESVRERCGQVFELAKEGKTKHIGLHLDKMAPTVDLVIQTMTQNYPDLNIPFHSRWRHFKDGAVAALEEKWPCDKLERARRMIDLVTVSVLLDAGIGAQWKYTDADGITTIRSEGIAAATLDMFADGRFSSDPALPNRVNSLGLKNLTKPDFAHAFQVSNSNPMVGLDGRFKLLHRLARALNSHPEYFGREVCRPGNLVDYLMKYEKNGHVSVRVLWKAIIEGYEAIWPERISGIRRGDIWVYNPLKKAGKPGSDMVPFHKLSQWLAFSCLEPLQELGIIFDDMHLLTGLAEYRNGGLFIDTGLLAVNRPQNLNILHDVGSELIVEWRALTVCLLDALAAEVRKKLNMTAEQLPLVKVLQGGTWAAGRIIAKQKRESGGPPLQIRSDGNTF